MEAGSELTVLRFANALEIEHCDGFPAMAPTGRILDTSATGLIHLQSIAQPNVAATLPSVEPPSLRPTHQAADDEPRSAHLVRLYAVPAARVASIR